MKYILKLPQNFNSDKKYPLIVYLHGAGSRGNTTYVLQNAVIFKYSKGKKNFPAVILAPLCSADTWFDVYEQLLTLIDFITKLPFIDEKKISLTGVSMGGYAAWQILMSRASLFCSAVICCGGGMYWNAAVLKGIPIRVYHGKDDTVVYPSESKNMVEAVNRAGGEAELKIFPDVDHVCWDRVYNSEATYRFLIEQKGE